MFFNAHLLILSILDVVVTSEAAGFAKPAPEIFLHACNKMGLQPRETIYVRDNLALDAIASINAGLVGVWLDRHNNDSPGDVNRINRLTELYKFVQKNL